MTGTVTVESFDDIDAYEEHHRRAPQGQHVFTLPRWMRTWRRSFMPEDPLRICAIKMDEKVIGVAPLSIKRATASFVGSADVSDYMDFTVAPGYEREFYHALLDDLSKRGVTELDLRCLRPESTVFCHLLETARSRNGQILCEPDGVSLEMDLPGDWNQYLNMLDGRKRHEIRRKLRRLHEAGETRLLVLEEAGAIAEHLDAFLTMFRESRPDRASFMDSRMESFFRSMMRVMSEERMLRLFVLTLRDSPVAVALCFDYRDTVYLYNSGYDPRYGSLSVGLLCKILSIKHSIAIGRKKYDFLKGAETYKFHLGGKEVHLYRCRISFE